MFVFHFNINVPFIIQNIKTALITILRNNPSVSSEFKKVLMEITDSVVVSLIYLTNTLGFYRLPHRLTIYLCIECKFNRVNNIFIEFLQINIATILQDRSLYMIINIFIRNKAKIILSHIASELKNW